VDFLFEYTDGEGRRVVVDDDGIAAYAYLILPDDAGTSVVWLYNRVPAPESFPERPVAPPNTREYVIEGFEPPNKEDFAIAWQPEIRGAGLFIRDELHAVLEEFEPTGRCRLAKRDGPVALTLSSEGWHSPGKRRDRFMNTYESDGVTALIEADPDACYAYLYKGSTLLSYVWLYNRTETTEEVTDIGTPGKRKANPDSKPFEEPTRDEITVMTKDGQTQAAIYIRNKLHAIVKEGEKPGRCVLATKENALARPYEIPVGP